MATIVVPLDGSEVSERALPHARLFAARLNADIVLVSVVEAPSEFASWAASPAAAHSPDIKLWIDDREAYLARVAAVHLRTEKARFSVTIGPPAPAIVDVAKGVDDPLIVMASHGRTGFRRFVVGSVTGRVVRIAPCPVVVVPAHGEDPAEPGMDRVLVPLDGSRYSLRALNVAWRVLGFSGTRVYLVQVIDVPTITPPALDAAHTTPVDYGVLLQYTEAMRQEAERYLDNVRAELTSHGIWADWEVREGSAAEEIQIATQNVDAQLIAMATHGRTGLERAVIGSVAEKLLSEIRIPILLVGPGES